MGHQSQFFYDQSGRLITSQYADGRTTQSAYTPNDELAGLILPNNALHEMLYGAFDFLTSYHGPVVDGTTGALNLSYNNERQIASISRADGRTNSYVYDAAGRLQSDGDASSFGSALYDPQGRVKTLSSSDSVIITKSYIGQEVSSKVYSGRFNATVGFTFFDRQKHASQSVNGQIVPFVYDADERLMKADALTLARDTASGLITGYTLGGTSTALSYNEFGEINSAESAYSGSSLFKQSFTRDKLGRISKKTETVQGATSTFEYGYDLTGRLVSVLKNGTLVSSYTYDANNNRISATLNGQTLNATYDAQDRLISYGPYSYTYTNNGDLLSKANTAGQINYAYDLYGQLKRAEISPSLAVDFLTDGENHRVQTKVNGSVQGMFVYDEGNRIIGDLLPSGQLFTQYVYAYQSHSPDFMMRSGTRFLFVKDQLGSIRMVLNTATGQISQSIEYDEYGQVLSDTSPGFQPFGFAGGIYNANTKLVRFGVRDYDPETGRWASKDPIGFNGGSENLYSYAGNDPVNNIDPSGEYLLQVIGALIGAYNNYNAAVQACGSNGQVLGSTLLGAATGALSTFGIAGSAAAGFLNNYGNQYIFHSGSISSGDAIGAGVTGGVASFIGFAAGRGINFGILGNRFTNLGADTLIGNPLGSAAGLTTLSGVPSSAGGTCGCHK